MDVTRAVELLRRIDLACRGVQTGPPPSSPWVPAYQPTGYVGDGLLRCGACRQPVIGLNQSKGWAPAPLSAVYVCPSPLCKAARARVRNVDRQLQARTRERWAEPDFRTAQGRIRMTELDTEVADAFALHEYLEDPRQRKAVARQMGGRGLLIGSNFDLSLERLNDWAVRLVTDRAELSAALGGRPTPEATATLAELRSVASDLRVLAALPLLQKARAPYRLDKHAVRSAFGNERQQRAQIDALTARLWTLLAETDWRDASPAPPPTEDEALTGDWGESPMTMTARRRALLDKAAEGLPLLLDPAPAGEAVLRWPTS